MKTSFRVLGVSGKAGAGKDYLTRRILVPAGFLPVALADEIKSRFVAEGRATYEEVYQTKPPAVRRALQEYGTEQFRDSVSKDYWIDCLFTRVRRWSEHLAASPSSPVRGVVITDVRFPNEVLAVQSRGGAVIRIVSDRQPENPLTPEAQQHPSETALDDFTNFDWWVNNRVSNAMNVENELASIVARYA